jgi:hypothetical protein
MGKAEKAQPQRSHVIANLMRSVGWRLRIEKKVKKGYRRVAFTERGRLGKLRQRSLTNPGLKPGF